jgi:hypothetical protein
MTKNNGATNTASFKTMFRKDNLFSIAEDAPGPSDYNVENCFR